MSGEPPRSTVQIAGQAANEVINGLKQSPSLLALVVLNILAIGVGVWFLRDLADNARAERATLTAMIRDCAK